MRSLSTPRLHRNS